LLLLLLLQRSGMAGASCCAAVGMHIVSSYTLTIAGGSRQQADWVRAAAAACQEIIMAHVRRLVQWCQLADGQQLRQ
jgi:hypothetical protein